MKQTLAQEVIRAPFTIPGEDQVTEIDPSLEYLGVSHKGSTAMVFKVLDTRDRTEKALKVVDLDMPAQSFFRQDHACIARLTEREVANVPRLFRTYHSPRNEQTDIAAFLTDYIHHESWDSERRTNKNYSDLTDLFIQMAFAGVSPPKDCHHMNVVMGLDNQPKVLDFGESKMDQNMRQTIKEVYDAVLKVKTANKYTTKNRIYSFFSEAFFSM